MISEKDVVLRERSAYRIGASHARILWAKFPNESAVRAAQKETEAMAKDHYPLPKITRQRTVVIESGVMRHKTNVQWSPNQNAFYAYYTDGEGRELLKMCESIYETLLWCAINTSEAVKYEALLQDLRANPTEEVEDDSE